MLLCPALRRFQNAGIPGLNGAWRRWLTREDEYVARSGDRFRGPVHGDRRTAGGLLLVTNNVVQRDALKRHMGATALVQNANGFVVDHGHARIARTVAFIE